MTRWHRLAARLAPADGAKPFTFTITLWRFRLYFSIDVTKKTAGAKNGANTGQYL